MTERCQYVGVDLAGKDHLRHLQRSVVRYATSFDDRLFDTEFGGEFAQLFASAMHGADANSDLVQQGKLFGERREILVVFGDFAGKLDDKRVSLEALDVRQRFAQ